MRVCLLVHELAPSGGVKVLLAHARALREAGGEVELLLTGGGDATAAGDLTVRSLAEARGESYDWAIATWWETADALYEVDAARRLAFLQSFEQRFYTDARPFERQGAASVLALPVDFIVVSEWMGEMLAELRPEASFRVVHNGVDKNIFGKLRRSARDGPLRVLVEGEPALWFKGVPQALEAVEAASEPVRLARASLDPGVRRTPGEMAELYADTDVLLKLSRIEGLGLPIVEAAHAGVPSVVTPFGSHDDLIEHGLNGLVVGFDDIPGAAAALDAIARDGELLERLSEGALRLAEEWPSEEEAGAAFAAALDELSEEARPDPAVAVGRLLAATRLTQDATSGGAGGFGGSLRDTEAALADAQALVHELSASRDECGERLHEALEELERIRSKPAYRAASKAKSVIRRDK